MRKCPGHISKNFIDRNFNRMFELADKGLGRIFVQDGDPCQNSAAAKRAIRTQAEWLKLPPRSSDLTPLKISFTSMQIMRYEKKPNCTVSEAKCSKSLKSESCVQ